MKKRFCSFALALSLCLFYPRPSLGIGENSPTGVAGDYNGSVTTAGSIDPYTGNARRVVDDIVVTGSVGAYPLKWSRIHNTRASNFGGFGLGGAWSHAYQWGLWVQRPVPPPTIPPYEGPDGMVSLPDGREMALRLDSDGYVQADNQGEPFGRLQEVTDGFDFILNDGGRVEFRHQHGSTSGSDLLPIAIVDPFGQRTTLERDSAHRLSKITEPGGRFLKINYETFYWYYGGQLHSTVVIESVQAFDGRSGSAPTETVSYSYIEAIVGAWGLHYRHLTQANYADGTAYYTYENSNLPDQYPYIYRNVLSTCDDLRYAGPMKRIRYHYATRAENPYNPAWGQVKAEKNLTTGQTISEVIYPQVAADYSKRWEKRADGSKRFFQYSATLDAELQSYTDFGNPNPGTHTSTIHYEGPLGTAEYRKIFTDARNNWTTVGKEWIAGAVVFVQRNTGPPAVYTYSDENNPYYLASKTDERTNPTFYDRDANNRIWRIRYPDDGFETFTYDNNPFGLVHEHRMTSGGTEVFEYDSRGLKTSYTPPATLSDPNPAQHKTLYFYYGGPSGPGEAPEPMRPDLMDRLHRVMDPRGNSTWYEYNSRGQVTQVTHQDGTFTRSEYNTDGTLAWTEDELRHRMTYEYDEYKRVTKITNPLEKETHNSYEPWNGHGALSHTTSSIYLTTLPSQRKIKRDYDNNFRLIETTVGWNTPEAASTTNTYDEVGNLKTVKDPKGQSSDLVTEYGYNERNLRQSVTDALNHTTAWLYDDAGNMTTETRADQKSRTWDEYDAMNRIKRTTGFLHEHTLYDYDLAGNQTKMTADNGGIYQTTYDELNRKTTSSYPTDATNHNRSETWRYDIAGNLMWYRNPADQFKHLEYDARNRQWHSYWNNSETGALPDPSVGPETTTTSDAANRVTEIRTNGNETIVAYHYDNANHKIWEDQTVAGMTHRVQTDPDDDGNRGTLSVTGAPEGYSFTYSFTYEYTQRQQLWHIYSGGSPFVEYTYDENGNLKKRQFMAQGQGQDSTSFLYDDVNRVTLCEQTGHNDQPVFSRSNYNDYDLVNNLKSISRLEDGDKGEIFGYDDANQLSSVSYNVDVVPHAPGPGGNPGEAGELGTDSGHESLAALEADPDREPRAEEATEPDAATGPRTVAYNNNSINRTSMTDNGTVTNFTPNQLNQYTAVTGHGTLSYDEKFNLSAYDGWIYTYDAEKRLVSVAGTGPVTGSGSHGAQFVYDGLGRCVKRTIDGVATIFTYDEWKPVAEWDSDGVPVAWNLYGPGADEILVRNQPSTGYKVHYHLDGMGNVQFLLNGNEGPNLGLGLEKYTYDVFGKPRITGWTGGVVRPISHYGNRFLFTGREYLYTLGIYDYRHRFYHPGLGRFIQTDPIGFGGDPMNLYRYCGANPVNHSDPTGLFDTATTLWKMQKIFDNSCGFQGDYNDFLGNRPQAGMEGVGESGTGGKGDMASIAEDKISSTKYANTKNWKGENVNHCNEFPADVAKESGRTPPQVPYSDIRGLFGFKRNATTNELANPKVKIKDWSAPEPATHARRTDIIAQQHGKWGHCGIVVCGTNPTISVNTDEGGIVRRGDWGFRDRNARPNNGEGPNDPAPVVRHYIGE